MIVKMQTQEVLDNGRHKAVDITRENNNNFPENLMELLDNPG